MLSIVIIAVAILLAGYLALSKRLSGSSDWQATVTPLASIMGSGFLVSAPLLAGIVGNLAVIAMALLLVLAYLVGGAIRFNIRHFEPIENDGHRPAQDTAFLSRIVLVGAYFISVTYYLQLLAAFVLNAIDVDSQLAAHIVTTTLLVIIGGIGMWRGLNELAAVEKYAVALNLGTIGALLVALAVYNLKLLAGGEWALPAISSAIDLHDLRVLLGLLIVANLFALILYAIFPPFAPLIFWGLNGFLLGREYFQLVAIRRMDRPTAKAMFRANLPQIWFAGSLMAVPLSIPLINLLVPILGAATFTHLFHRIYR